MDIIDLYKTADFLRKDLMRVAVANKKGHIAPSLSCLDILIALNYSEQFKKDYIILSKAHGCYGAYAIDADLGRISRQDWENFNLCGTYEGLGSLGHGYPIGVGIAFGCKLRSTPHHTFVIVGDGELQEGSNWEALSFTYHHNLHNITMIVDNNGLQAVDKIDAVLEADLARRFIGWGITPYICDGHNYTNLLETLAIKPQIIIANTIKGKGYGFMEGQAKWHYRLPSKEELSHG